MNTNNEEQSDTPSHLKHGFTLLPCPFCNENPMWVNEAIPDSHFHIRCIPCGFTIKADRRNKAVGMWNTRPGERELKDANTKVTEENYKASLREKIETIRVKAIKNYHYSNSSRILWERQLAPGYGQEVWTLSKVLTLL